MRDMLLVLNFDDASSRSIARKLRAERIYCKIIPGDTRCAQIKAQEALGLVLAGGSTGNASSGLDEALLAAEIPLLAFGDAAMMALGMITADAGEVVLRDAVRAIDVIPSPLTEGVEKGERMLSALRQYPDSERLETICRAQDTGAGFKLADAPVYLLQFQVERNDTEGLRMLSNFALSVCGCTQWWDDEAFVRRAEEEISRAADGESAVCAMTGGLDSGVSALLAHRALGDQLRCIFVDTGLLRDNEGDDFMAFYQDEMNLRITRVFAQERFLRALKGLTLPDEKRAAIGRTLQEILDEESEKLKPFGAVVRGTSCNDVMEGLSRRENIPAVRAGARSIEPVRELFKDEIRRIGESLGMPYDVFSRQPFPGSGLALRIMGEVTETRLQLLRAADAIFREEIASSGLQKKLWMYFAILSPGAEQPGENIVCLRAVQAGDGAQAYAARLPYDLIERVTARILKECPGVRRVLYDLTPSTHYAGVEWR